MILRCFACTEMKGEECFDRNRSRPSGRQQYCKDCHKEYRINGRTWSSRKERTSAMIATGLKFCPQCKENLSLDKFYSSAKHHSGYFGWCIVCCRKRANEDFKRPEKKAKVKAYYARPEIKEREEARKRATPRNALNVSLIRALKRRPTANAITIDELVQMWKDQDGKCAITGLTMTWRRGKRFDTSISIDRVDQSIGYERSNLRLICDSVNRFRGDGSDAEMLTMARAIVDNMSKSSREPSWQPHIVSSEAA